MELAVVIGQVVSTVKCPGIHIERLLLVDFVDAQGKPKGEPHVAADSIGAGNGEWVLVTQGSSARRAARVETHTGGMLATSGTAGSAGTCATPFS